MKIKFALGGLLAATLLPMVMAGCGGGGSAGSASAGAGSAQPFTSQSSDGDALAVVPANDVLTAAQTTVRATSSAPASTGLVPGTTYDFGPTGTKFSTQVALTIKYAPSALPDGATEGSLALYTVTKGDWTPVMGSKVDTASHTVTAPVSHFGTYGILASNTFAGQYTGHYSGDSAGTITMTVNQSGALKASGMDPSVGAFAGTGSLTLTGDAKVTVKGSGSSGQDVSATFSGAFQNSDGQHISATGDWSEISGSSGVWSLP